MNKKELQINLQHQQNKNMVWKIHCSWWFLRMSLACLRKLDRASGLNNSAQIIAT